MRTTALLALACALGACASLRSEPVTPCEAWMAADMGMTLAAAAVSRQRVAACVPPSPPVTPAVCNPPQDNQASSAGQDMAPHSTAEDPGRNAPTQEAPPAFR